MKIYFAGIPGNKAVGREKQLLKMKLFQNRLLSYFWIIEGDRLRFNLYLKVKK